MMLSCPKRQVLDASKLKDLADDNFKFDLNGRKFSKWVENTVRKYQGLPGKELIHAHMKTPFPGHDSYRSIDTLKKCYCEVSHYLYFVKILGYL